MPIKDWAKCLRQPSKAPFELQKMRLTIKFFAHCGERPKTLSLETANFLKKVRSKTFVSHQRVQPEASDLRESEALKFALSQLRELRAGSACYSITSKPRSSIA